MQKIDVSTWVAAAGVIAGWFWLNTLVAAFGPIQHVVHFYELSAAIQDPRWLLYGVGQSASLGAVVSGLVCLAVVAAPLLARMGYVSRPRLLSALPLALMVLCGITLYVKSSSAHIEATDSLGRGGGYLARWANGATRWGGDVVARHIAIGAGAYVSLLGSAWLAVKGVTARQPAAVQHPA